MSRQNIYQDLIGKLEKKVSGIAENTLLPPEQSLSEEFGVSKPTLRRALQAMADAGRIKKINGVGVIVTKPTKTISRELIFLCHDIVFFAESLKSFGIRATESNYFISIVPLAGDEQTQNRIVASIAERKPAGVAIYADPRMNHLTAFHQLAASGIPTVYLIRLPHGLDGNLLEFGNADGVSEIVETFYEKGCRRFAFYSDPASNPAATEERLQGFLYGMKKCRLKTDEDRLALPSDDSKKRKTFLRLFSDPAARPDAVCCANDYCAGTLIHELKNQNIDISGIRFSGFDASPFTRFIQAPLLTVRPPMRELGQEAAEILIRQVENPHFGFKKSKLKAKVVKTSK